MESNIKEVPFSSKSRYHFGKNCDIVEGYFVKGDDEKKRLVPGKPVYKPDELYNLHDGYLGRCWIITLTDSDTGEETKYFYRNFMDLNEYMVADGYKNFVIKKG